jgi:hypothetical protein
VSSPKATWEPLENSQLLPLTSGTDDRGAPQPSVDGDVPLAVQDSLYLSEALYTGFGGFDRVVIA